MFKYPTSRELGIAAGLIIMALLLVLGTLLENRVLMVGGPLIGLILIVASATFNKDGGKQP